MRVIVTSSRTWPEDGFGQTIVFSTLQGVYNLNAHTGQPLTIVHGACPTGGDHLAHLWCERMKRWQAGAPDESLRLPGTSIIEEPHPAEWEKFGKGVGPKRNAEMTGAGEDLCIAFLYEPRVIKSAGTRGTMREAEFHGIKVVPIPWPIEHH